MSGDDLEANLAILGWSKRDLAERIGVHPNTVSQWAQEHREVPGPAAAYLTLAVRVKTLL